VETYFLKHEDISKFYGCINEDFKLYVPFKVSVPARIKCDYGFNLPSDDYLLKSYSALKEGEVCFNEYRCLEPTARAFFTYFKEEVCEYFQDKTETRTGKKAMAISGVKNCDLFAAKIQDFVFLEGVEEDSLYKERRQNTLIISSDCPNFKETCFCRAFQINPYAQDGFDFNLSPITNGYLVDIATKRAKLIVGSLKNIFIPASVGQLSARSVKRDAVVKRMEEHLAHHKIPKKENLKEIVLSGYNSALWQEQMKTCVECGGCIFICDTCHCFLLSDELKSETVKRLRVWDGCLLKNFSRVAGGANPLKLRYQRLRNRYLKKFDFFVDNLGYQACCGCGRCIDVCPGKIDIRHILRKLYEEKYLPAS
jgi:ferredoxin